MHLKKITSAIIAIILSFAMLQVTSEPSMAQEVSSANQMPGSNHFYYYLPGSYSWQSAHDSAVALTFRGMQGHLANVTSSEENNFIASFAGRGWLGAKRDPAQTFRWVDGPEAGNSLTYSSWCPGEPNNWGGGEPYVETSGCWNDNGGHGEQFGAIVEFEPVFGEKSDVSRPYVSSPTIASPSGEFYETLSLQVDVPEFSSVVFNAPDGSTFTGSKLRYESKTDSNCGSEINLQIAGGANSVLIAAENSVWGDTCKGIAKHVVGNLYYGVVRSLPTSTSFPIYEDGSLNVDVVDFASKIYSIPAGARFTTADLKYQSFSNPSCFSVVTPTLNTGSLSIRIAPAEFPDPCIGQTKHIFGKINFQLIKFNLAGIGLVGQVVQGNLGKYPEGYTSISSGWQKSADGEVYNYVSSSDVSRLGLDDNELRLLEPDEEKFFRYFEVVSIGTAERTFYSDPIQVGKTQPHIQQKSTLGYDTLCLIRQSTNKLNCLGPTLPNWTDDFQSVDASVNSLCAVTISGKAKCLAFRNGNFSQDGKLDSDGFVSGVSSAVAITNGWAHTCALIVDGTVSCWGYGYWGVFGSDNYGVTATPVKVPGLTNVIQIESGWDHLCALTASGDVYCWGRNNFGQIGLGYTSSLVSVPTKVMNVSKATSISAERYHSCATTSDGKVWCWGDNYWGETGNGTIGGSTVSPAQVSNLNEATQVYSGSDYNCAIAADGRAYCWGANNVSQIISAPPSQNSITTPIALPYSEIGGLITGHGQSCSILRSGQVNCWGVNQFGPQLIPDQSATYQLNENTFAPKVPKLNGIKPLDSGIEVQFDSSIFKAGVSYQARTLDGSSLCEASDQGACKLAGLTNYKPYTLQYRANSEAGFSGWQTISRQYIPHIPGFQMKLDDNNLSADEATFVRVLDATPNSTVWVKVGSNPKIAIRSDENGAAATTIWLSKNSSAKVAITSGKTTISKYLYSPKLIQLSTLVRVNRSGKIVVQYAMPGSEIKVTLADGRTFTTIAGSTVNTALNVSFANKGTYTYSVKVNGRDLGTGIIAVF